MITHRAAAIAAALLALGALGCAEPHRSGSVVLRLTAGEGAVAVRGRDSIIVRRAQLVLKEIQLAPAGSGECDAEEEDEEAGAPLEMGPVLATLPPADPTAAMLTVRAPADT